jgi:predicted dehydrogenase
MIRIGTVGTSMITRAFVAAARTVPGIEVTVVHSRDADRAAEFAASLGVPGSTADLAGLLASGAVDALYVGSPNGAHEAQVRQALEAGRHVLVEKPAVPTAAAFAGLLALARYRGVVLFEGMRAAYDPGMAAVAGLLPRLGRVRRVSLGYSQRSSRYDDVLAGRRVNIFDPALAGGALNDLGSYCASVLVQLFGEPDRVLAAGIDLAGGADGAGAALVGYPGMLADLSWSKITGSTRPSQVEGELATLEIDRITAPRHLSLRSIGGQLEEFDLPQACDAIGPLGNIAHEVVRFVELVGGADPAPDQARTLAALRLLDGIRAAQALPGIAV